MEEPKSSGKRAAATAAAAPAPAQQAAAAGEASPKKPKTLQARINTKRHASQQRKESRAARQRKLEQTKQWLNLWKSDRANWRPHKRLQTVSVPAATLHPPPGPVLRSVVASAAVAALVLARHIEV